MLISIQVSQQRQFHQLHPVHAFRYQHLSFAESMTQLGLSLRKVQVSEYLFQSKYG